MGAVKREGDAVGVGGELVAEWLGRVWSWYNRWFWSCLVYLRELDVAGNNGEAQYLVAEFAGKLEEIGLVGRCLLEFHLVLTMSYIIGHIVPFDIACFCCMWFYAICSFAIFSLDRISSLRL